MAPSLRDRTTLARVRRPAVSCAAMCASPAGAVPGPEQLDRVRAAWSYRPRTDYLFDFTTALGWTVLTLGVYWYYVLFQLVRRMRAHNLRRHEFLEAASTVAWEKAQERGLADELRPYFERVGGNLAVMRAAAGDFRDPLVWLMLTLITGGIAGLVAYVLVDGDLVTHETAELAVESDLALAFSRLDVPVAASADTTGAKARHNYVGRLAAFVFTFGLYGLWWTYDLMTEGNNHFSGNWVVEDQVATAVQTLAAA